ncbi:hypothetical protein [Hymenobacter roseosalivarius]|uniref:hypothetical protein n=1 Tax=Hymenobacter roseosalivarius TaxID=89967 RepID=UPI00117A6DEE|nr:hypothetical protein [Hymenobacter roseosalivarius]
MADGKGCIKQVATSPDAHAIAKAEQAIAVRLFQQNGIDLSNLRFTRFIEEDLDLNGRTNHYVHVSAAQFGNGLPFLTGGIIYAFKDGKFTFLSGELLTTTVDPKPVSSLAQVRSAFFTEFIKYEQNSSFYKAKDFKDKCLTAELGYFTLRGGETQPKSVLAWHVKPKDAEYPTAYINDRDNTIIYFFDGVWTLGPR